PSPLRKVPLVEISTRPRRPPIARPRISSDCPCEYTSALSNIDRPASRHTSTRRVASLTSLAPQGLKKSVWPPNVPVPNVRIGTFSPELPSCRYSICVSSSRAVRPVRACRGGSRSRTPPGGCTDNRLPFLVDSGFDCEAPVCPSRGNDRAL